ncbi:hypothetical protein [Gordonia rhizosphera]|uniref:DUF8176 domain-containing protein n=1 Tax=Gordonia rhizosphera NBRC 16068 TaxID=1108045 RepID=K6V0U9_9ACTN|nr:hypothetical protein [Gordonia rhizosphera]GAB89508.1 hypothetical protein GORHZ_063_00020 [Gordonia rhizosphera NBRC 16068]
MVSGGHEPDWFGDIPAWPATGRMPARELASALTAARVATLEPGTPTTAMQGQESFLPTAESAVDWTVPDASASDGPSLDDPFEQMRLNPVTPEKKSGPTRFWTGHRGTLLGAAAVLVVLGAAAGVALSQAGGGTEQMTNQAAESTTAITSSAPVDTCPALVDGGVTTGDGPGDQNSGAGAILAFNHAYYVSRSAARARAVSAPNAVASEDVMQQYIDQRPVGTTHCLSITDEGNNTYDVVLTEYPPGAATIVYHQIIRTVESDGKTYIASIKAVD